MKRIYGATDLRLTVGRTTTTATLAKIDPDNGSADDLGPGTIKYLTASARHQFNFGTLQAVLSKADARLATFNGVPGTVTPEAPRTIFDALATLDKLPLQLARPHRIRIRRPQVPRRRQPPASRSIRSHSRRRNPHRARPQLHGRPFYARV